MNASVKIICKKNSLKNGLFPIYLRVTIDRKSKFYSLPFSCKLSEWNEKQGEFNKKFPNYISINKAIRKTKENAYDVISKLEQDYHCYNLILFDKYYSNQSNSSISFCELFEKEIKILYDNEQTGYADSMNFTLFTLKKFKKNLYTYKLENIDYLFLTDFENFLRKGGANDGGICVYMKNIRAIYNRGINYKIVQPQYYPFRDFKISKYKKRKIRKALNEKELKTFIDFDTNKLPASKNARNLYLFSYFARGMNFTDLAELKWSDLDDNQFTYVRNKTHVFLKIKLPDNPYLKEILEFYKIYRPFDTPYIFPILKKEKELYTDKELRNRKDSVKSHYNKELKKILIMCKIDKNIHFYTARHTFATAALRNNVNINIIKQSLGHKKLSTTESYLDDFNDHEVNYEINKIF
ncbi:tyrosine-type recombinase/integrase [Cloacibacterium normanense]|uniref:tyrosine-type recombinase/integrase n=1 Tax=Cloacibacterium normanense TaxID=237258 RepID=UPI00391A40E4